MGRRARVRPARDEWGRRGVAPTDVTPDELRKLIPLQEADRELDALRREIGAIEAGEPWREAEGRRDSLAERAQALGRERQKVERERRQAELERRAAEEEGRRLAARLQGGRLRNAREYESVERELAAARRRASDAETAELVAMERLDALEAEIARLGTALAEAEKALAAARRDAEARRAELAARLSAAEARRAERAQAVAPELAAAYEEARRAGRGLGVAVLERSRCRACGLELPAAFAERIRRGRVVRCENCHRILVPGEADPLP